MSMNLSGKQRDELNRAIADYLQSSGYHASFSAFMGEADLNENVGDLKSSGLLEKKWTSVLRLQKKVMDLESKLKETEKEIASGAPTRDKRKPEEWIPRAPERFELSGHRMPVNRVIFHPKYTYFASCSEDCTIKIWDFESGEFERTLKGHTAAVQDICFDKSGTLLASCSADLTIKIWDFVNSYECTKTLKGHDHNISSITFVPSGDYLLSSSRDRQVKMWEVSTGYCIHTFGGHTDWVRMVRVSHDGSQFATCGNDHTVRVWSIQGKAEKMTLHGHEHVVECVTWVPDAALPYISHQDLAKMNGGGSVAASAESNALLLSGSRDKTIRCWNVHTNQCLFVLTGHDNWVRGIVFHPHGKFIVSVSDDKSMKIWATEGRRCQKTISAHGKFVTSIDFHSKLPKAKMPTTSIFKSRVGTELLMGRVVKVSRIGLDKVPCAQVRCQRNEFNIYLKKYFARSFDYWAMDASNIVGMGDTVLIKQMEKIARPMATVRHSVDRVVFKYGNIIDPVMQRRVIEDQFEDEMELRKKLVSEIVEDPFKEESLLFDERRAVQKEKLEAAKKELQEGKETSA